jgi:hypothetical protein
MAVRAFLKSVAGHRLGRAAALATAGVVALVVATPAAAFADVTLPIPQVFSHTNLKSCDQVAPTGDVALLTSGGKSESASGPAGTGTLSGTLLDVHIVAGYSVTAIIVKGGDDSNLYSFVPPVAGPADFNDLQAPLNNGNQVPAISHWLVCGFQGETPPPTSAVLTSEVHDSGHAVVDNSNPATAPADVHDSVILTVSGLPTWSGNLTMRFFTNGDCAGDAAHTGAPTAVTQATSMPLEDLLPQNDLAAGSYSYQASFDFAGVDHDSLNLTGPCEPFKVVDPTTPTPETSTSSLAVTGNTVGGVGVGTIAVAGLVLVAVGTALVFFRRRRSLTE